MKFKLFLLAGFLISCAPEGELTSYTDLQDQKAFDRLIYGDDDRHDLYDTSSVLYKKLADSTVALLESSSLSALSSTSFNFPTGTYGRQQLLCTTEPFYDQPAGAFCSGSLVGPNLILTAGHCIKDVADCADVRFVFGYAVKQAGKYPLNTPNSEVYSCKRIVSRKLEATGVDYALIETDRPVVGHEVLKLQRSRVAAVGDALTVIGHPSGLPTKVASGGKVRKVVGSHLVTNLDTYGGNSGSGVFNSETGEIVGILVRGDTDFVQKGSCYVSNRCPADGCRGEDVTRIDQVVALIPVSPGPAPSPAPSPSPTPGSVAKIYTLNANAAVPDNNAVGVESSLQVPEAVAGRKVQIGVNLEHTYIGDITITLISPQGTSYVLQKNKGGRAQNLQGVFGDTLVSESSLAGLSSAPAGKWKLKVVDSVSRDVGTLKQWKIILK
jgi:subtilisin-like proprotein convertase family protein